MDLLLRNPRTLPALLAAACLGALGAAFASQYWGGLYPCVLCVYQRYAYGIALGFAVLAFLPAGSAAGRRLALLGSGLAFLGGAAIAVFHVGVEQKWWQGTAECHAPALPENATVEQLREILLNQPFAPCDKIPWEIFGISMAGFNVLAYVLLAALSFWAAFSTSKGAQT
ncbi:disulfide bond formation protein B [Pelagibius sp. CAU 1746]|uniref:disulfide bond formation protein B n=1 Tax=Pelagibius sp. CAU 1746 TaxID=3140370 RepID=UPI00325A75CB